MIKFRIIYDDINLNLTKEKIDSVIGIYEKAFPYYRSYSSKITKLLRNKNKNDFEVILIVAEGNKSRTLGFCLLFYFEESKQAYLDFLVSDPARKNRGIGTALYETSRTFLKEKGCQQLYMDVEPDIPELVPDKKSMNNNKKRLAFYEKFNAKPIIGTKYEHTTTKVNLGYPLFLVLDPLDRKLSLKAKDLKVAVEKIFKSKAKLSSTNVKVKKILDSIQDGKFCVREDQYSKPIIENFKKEDLGTIDIILPDEFHNIHHLHERGYVERPARIEAIKKGLSSLKVNSVKIKKHSQQFLKEVHDKELISLIKRSEKELHNHKPFYPDVYPKTAYKKLPQELSLKAGFFAIDSFTPLTGNVYKAASQAMNQALTGVDLILKGSKLAYAACRPPGHHAERKLYGGFCYFNNASIAAQALSKHGKVAFLDIDYHHGNGSQDIFYERNDVYFISIHGHPSQAYPFYSGFDDETGIGKGKGFNKNFPLYPGANNKKYLLTLKKAIDIFAKFKPKFLVVSTGLDIMKGDPTGTFVIDNEGMRQIGTEIGNINVPTLLVQEGGYSLSNLKTGIKNFLVGVSTKV